MDSTGTCPGNVIRIVFLMCFLIMIVLFLDSCDTTGSNLQGVDPEKSVPYLDMFTSRCSDARTNARLRISDGQLIYSTHGGGVGKPINLAGYGSYELVTDPNVIHEIGLEYGRTSNVFNHLLRPEADAAHLQLNMFRLWFPGYSTCAIEGGGYDFAAREEMPYYRFDDGRWDLARYDLDTTADTSSRRYFDRLQRVLDDARKAEIILQLTLFDHCMMKWLDVYDPETESVLSFRFWQHHPWNPDNNVNGLHDELPVHTPPFPHFYQIGETDESSPRPKLRRLQKKYVQTLVSASGNNPNVFYEIMNQADNASGLDLAIWHLQIIAWIKEIAPDKLISISSFPLIRFMKECYLFDPDSQLYTRLLNQIDVVCYHFSNESWAAGYDDCVSDMGKVIAEHQLIFPGKIALFDTDGAGGRWQPCREDNTNVSNWARTAFELGCSFNHKDYIYSEPELSVPECLDDPDTGCGYRYDCVQCGIFAVDGEAIAGIGQAYLDHPPGRRPYFDVTWRGLESGPNELALLGKNSGTKPLPQQLYLSDTCHLSVSQVDLAHEVRPGEEFTIILPLPQPDEYSFRVNVGFGQQLQPIGRTLSFQLN